MEPDHPEVRLSLFSVYTSAPNPSLPACSAITERGPRSMSLLHLAGCSVLPRESVREGLPGLGVHSFSSAPARGTETCCGVCMASH